MRGNIFCEYQSEGKSKNQFTCSIGLYGGIPYIGNCLNCVDKKQNTEAYASELFTKAERAHPSSAPRVSGCCDSARNYID
jgi:hypothetical protein